MVIAKTFSQLISIQSLNELNCSDSSITFSPFFRGYIFSWTFKCAVIWKWNTEPSQVFVAGSRVWRWSRLPLNSHSLLRSVLTATFEYSTTQWNRMIAQPEFQGKRDLGLRLLHLLCSEGALIPVPIRLDLAQKRAITGRSGIWCWGLLQIGQENLTFCTHTLSWSSQLLEGWQVGDWLLGSKKKNLA